MSEFRNEFVADVLRVLEPFVTCDADVVNYVFDAAKTAGYVVLTAEHFERLDRAEDKLIALENGGVDNWEGYGSAMRDAWQSDEDEDEDE